MTIPMRLNTNDAPAPSESEVVDIAKFGVAGDISMIVLVSTASSTNSPVAMTASMKSPYPAVVGICGILTIYSPI